MACIITFPYDSWEVIRFRADRVDTEAERYVHSALQLGGSVVSAYLDNGVLNAETCLAVVRFSTTEIVEVADITSKSVQNCNTKQHAAEQPIVSEEEKQLFNSLAHEPVTFVVDDTVGHSVVANASAMEASPSSFLRWTLGVRSFYDKTILDADKGLYITDATRDNIMRPLRLLPD